MNDTTIDTVPNEQRRCSSIGPSRFCYRCKQSLTNHDKYEFVPVRRGRFTSGGFVLNKKQPVGLYKLLHRNCSNPEAYA